MRTKLNILHLEDLETDAELIRRELERGGLDFKVFWVKDKEGFVTTLHQQQIDIILSDHSLPSMDSFKALELLQESRKKIPFILITSTTSEEVAVEVMKAGAWDYILKDRMQRLPNAVRSAIEKHAYEQERQEYIETVIQYNRRYEIVSKATNDAIWDWDIQKDIILWNHGITSIFGYTDVTSDPSPSAWKKKIHPQDVDRIDKEFEQAFQTQAKHWSSQYQFQAENGEYKYVLNRAYIIYKDQQPVQMIGAIQDITTQKKFEIAISKSEELFRALVENSGDVIGMTDTEGKMKYVSPSVKHICGYDPEEFLNLRFTDLLHPEDREAFKNFVNELLLTRARSLYGNFRIKHKKGHWQWMEGTAMNLSHLESINGSVVNFRDVTERKIAEDEKSTLVQQLIEQNNNLVQYSYIVSHNFRGPVARMLGLINLLNLEEVSIDKKEVINMLGAAAENLDEVIKDLGKILEIKSDKVQIKEWILIDDMLSEVKEVLRDQIEENGAVIQLNDRVEKAFFTIKSYFHSILYNLISNAIKYKSTHRNPVITIETFKSDTENGFILGDNGMGIDMDKFGDKIFKLYQRFHPTIEGKGLGLYLIRSQIMALRGTIIMQSEPNKGTNIRVTFPTDSGSEKVSQTLLIEVENSTRNIY